MGTASLDTLAGLITAINPSDLPEGASPRTWDTDFLTGSVFTRPGLSSVYVFTNVIIITSIVIVSGNLGAFTYVGKDPTVNESFILSGFTGGAAFLNETTITVISVDTINKTFTALVTGSGTFVGQNGTATSTTGDFVGPNIGGLATVISSGGNVWTNPTGVLGNTLYASVITGSTNSVPAIPGSASSSVWTNPSNILSTGAPVATISITAPTESGAILANNIGYSLPADATVTGISVSVQASSTAPAGTASLDVQLATNGNPIGTPVNVPLSPSTATYIQGSSTYQWGTTLSTDIVNGTALGILVFAKLISGGGTASFSANRLSVTVYYTTASSSEALQVTTFAFSIPSTSGISGFSATFEAFSTATTEVALQLLKDGLPTGITKTLVLNTTPTIYSLGGANDMWGTTWSFANVNSTQFGTQIITDGTGTTSIRDLDMLVYVIPGLSNFNYVKSFTQDNGQTDTLALDADGIMWREDVNNNPGVLAIVRSGVFPGSFAKSQTAQDREYICFSKGTFFDNNGTPIVNPTNPYGGYRPLTYDGSTFNPLTQVGPGAPPAFVGATGTNASGTHLNITSWAISSDVVTFTFDVGPTVAAGQVYNISGASPSYLNIVGVVLGTPPPTGTTMAMSLVKPNASGAFSPAATGVLQFNYPIQSITQNPQHALVPDSGGHGLQFWGAGPGPTHTPGSNFVVYYGQTEDTVLTKYFAAHPTSTYVYLSNLNNFPQFDGTYLITAVGDAFPSGTAGAPRFYFVVNVGTQGKAYPDGSTGNYQLTIATVTTTAAIAGLQSGNSVQITGETPISWNNLWSVVETLTSATLNVTLTKMSSTGVATYDFSLPSGGVLPTNGQIASITGCNNSGAGYTTSPFNTVGVIVYPGSDGAGSFDITGFTGGLPIAAAAETGTAITYGTQFSIDPGLLTLGTATNPIYGNAGASSGTTGVHIVGSSAANPIAAGTRQAVVFFITNTGYETAPSPPVVFTVPSNTTAINYSNLPIGPSNVVARGIAITEAGQNGIPGANFYVIPNPVVVQVLNGAPVVYGPTIIRDNTTTSGVITFTDSVLLSGEEIDIQGNNLFNLIELGSPAWCIPYASRMFYGLMLNKVDNFNNMSFDGGYNPTSTGTNLLPLGWQAFNTTDTSFTLINSAISGMSLYIKNSTGVTIANAGLLFQSAYQDVYKVPILLINTTYSVRVVCRNPSAITGGSLFISLQDFIPNIGFTTNYGGFVAPLTSMSTTMQEFTSTLLTVPFTTVGVSPNLTLAVQIVNLAPGADCEIDRIEIFPTQQPYLTTQVFGSYVNSLESIDTSGDGGVVDTTNENNQPCTGGFVMHDNLYLLKTNSTYFTQDTPTSEPGGWELHESSNKVGSIGIHSYDVGEEWLVTACRAGVFGFNGGQPVKMMQEIWNVWELINWQAGTTIVVRNDIINRRLFVAIPLPTPNKWLPFDPPNSSPTSPNVILMCNYQGLNTFEELVNSPEVHTTMFGTLAAVDMKRKWSIWRIKTPYMDFITRLGNENKPLFICNGIDSEKIYQFLDAQLSDDGVAINSLYTTYGFVNAAKAATLPIFGFHAKRYTILQQTVYGSGNLTIRALPNVLDPRYPYTLTGARTTGIAGTIGLVATPQDDWYRNLNAKGNRMFLEYSTNAVGAAFNLSKILLSGIADPHSPLNPTGGGNTGIIA